MEYAHDNPELYKIVTIQNVDTEDFVCYYNKSRNPKAYVMRAGEVRRYPKFLAKHLAKHLVDQILTRQEKKTSNQTFRNSLMEKIVLSEETDNGMQQVQSMEEQALSRVDDMNRENEMDALLKRREEEKKEEEVKPSSRPNFNDKIPAKKVSKELKDAKDPDELGNNRVNTKEAVTKTEPTKADLISYAKTSLSLTMDKKTKAAFDKMSVKELAEELNYPIKE